MNGRDLVDLVAAFEASFAEKLAGKYEPLPAEELLRPPGIC
jgi:hypothetical protein